MIKLGSTLMGIEQHFVALAGVGNEDEGAAGAELHVGNLHLTVGVPDSIRRSIWSTC